MAAFKGWCVQRVSDEVVYDPPVHFLSGQSGTMMRRDHWLVRTNQLSLIFNLVTKTHTEK